jgi:tight adherence protein C
VLFGFWEIIVSRSQILSRLPVSEAANKRKLEIKVIFAPLLGLSNFLLDALKLKNKINQKLYAAHIELTPAEFFVVKLIIMLILGSSTYFIFNKTYPLGFVLGLLAGYVIPDFWLNKKINNRKLAVVKLLPETVDLLALCMEAGLDFSTSMKWIVQKTRNTPMIEELAFVVEEIKWGKPRLQALRDMSERLNLQEVRSFVHILAQAEKMGTPVVEVLSMLSEDTRLQRFQRAERFALKAPIKMLIPLIFCILPVIAIVVGAPILLEFMEGSLTKGF